MLTKIKSWVRINLTRQFHLQSNIRIVPHSRPNVFNVYTRKDTWPWVRLYTGPINEGLMQRFGWGRRETVGEAVKRILRTIKATAVGLVR